MNDVDSGLLRCQQPPELRGLVFLELDPHAFCSAPLVLKLAIQDIQPFSVLVSWQSRNHSGIRGYQVAYHAVENIEEVKKKKNCTNSFLRFLIQNYRRKSFACLLYTSPSPRDS